MSSLHEELAELRARLRDVEDKAAITQLIAAYGPAVDSGDADAASSLWTEDGRYETDPEPLVGARAIAEMVGGPLHQEIITSGSAHFLGPASITIDGDSAVATGYSLLVRHTEAGFSVFRCSANRWVLTRTSDGWKALSRQNALLNGNPGARDLLRAAPGAAASAS
jgi:ketosteroid isomerase-like protein